jgi:hypothetical protein
MKKLMALPPRGGDDAQALNTATVAPAAQAAQRARVDKGMADFLEVVLELRRAEGAPDQCATGLQRPSTRRCAGMYLALPSLSG